MRTKKTSSRTTKTLVARAGKALRKRAETIAPRTARSVERALAVGLTRARRATRAVPKLVERAETRAVKVLESALPTAKTQLPDGARRLGRRTAAKLRAALASPRVGRKSSPRKASGYVRRRSKKR